MKIGVKPYPSCRYTHAALDALIAMRREHNLTPDQIKRVEIGLHRNGITLTGDAATKRHPTSIVGGQFSMFFTGAVALDQGRFGWDDYDRLGDAAVDALADKFDVVQDDRLEVGRSHPFGARVSITTDDGVHERLYRRSLRRAEFVPGRAGDAAEVSDARPPGAERPRRPVRRMRSCRWNGSIASRRPRSSAGNRCRRHVADQQEAPADPRQFGERPALQTCRLLHVARRVTQTSAVWPNSSISRSGAAPSRRATPCDAVFSRSMQWITRSSSKVANAQSIEARAASAA